MIATNRSAEALADRDDLGLIDGGLGHLRQQNAALRLLQPDKEGSVGVGMT